jgi:ribulose-phosphate 3-epimerase
MQNQIQVIPAIIPSDLDTVRDKFAQVKGLVEKVQIDFVDGVYAPQISWPFNAGQDAEFSEIFIGHQEFPFIHDLNIEADLFVNEPEDFLNKLIAIGFKNFVLHLDSTHNLFECLAQAKQAGGEVGIGVKPSADWNTLEQYLNKCDFVQFMGNDKVGYNGVGLDERVLEKIKSFKETHPDVPAQIDIGVNFETVTKIKEAGVTRLVSGSTVFESELPPADAIKRLQENN